MKKLELKNPKFIKNVLYFCIVFSVILTTAAFAFYLNEKAIYRLEHTSDVLFKLNISVSLVKIAVCYLFIVIGIHFITNKYYVLGEKKTYVFEDAKIFNYYVKGNTKYRLYIYMRSIFLMLFFYSIFDLIFNYNCYSNNIITAKSFVFDIQYYILYSIASSFAFFYSNNLIRKERIKMKNVK